MNASPRITLSTLAVLLLSTNVQASCNENITPSTPDSRFSLHTDGTATDNETGLQWMRCSVGQTWDGATCLGSASSYNWVNALSMAESYSFAGINNWRLPNIKELASLAELACVSPAINTTVFPETPLSFFWSSSPYANFLDLAWYVSFDSGYDGANGRSGDGHVRLVRAGQ